MKTRFSILVIAAFLTFPFSAYAVKLTLEETITADGVRYSFYKYVPNMRISGCPWRQASYVLAESLPSATAPVRGEGCWIQDASWGDITVWIENQKGNDVTRMIQRTSDVYRPDDVISNIERLNKICQTAEQDTGVACENRESAVDYLRMHGWCWNKKAPIDSKKRWFRCPPQ